MSSEVRYMPVTKSKFYISRTFVCKRCKCMVTTTSGVLDRRTQFCSSLCQRRFWRHPERRNRQIVENAVNISTATENERMAF